MVSVTTICAAFEQTAERYGPEPALRTADRSVALSWEEFRARVERSARGLSGLGIAAGDTVGLMLSNRPEFHILDLAAIHLGATPFSLYNTSSTPQIEHVLANSDCRVVICEGQFVSRVSQAQSVLPDLTHLVVLESERVADLPSLAEVEAHGDQDLDYEAGWRAVTPEGTATIIYTSGTTGPPKGVELSHGNLLAAWEASVAAVPALGRRGRYVSYLPTAHLADRMFSHYPAIITGSEITCVEDPRAAIGQLPSIRPTLFLAVPRIWEKLKDAIEAGLEAGLEADLVPDQIGLSGTDLLASGAAPIHADVLEFFDALGLSICEGYGMTESTAVATLNRPGRQRFGTVGPPMPGVEVGLAADGEVLLRGPAVMVGYRHQPDQTAEAIDRDGWLHTGDIGRFDEHGHLVIVDRKKELIINAAGKNMSPANIEAQIKAASSLVAQAIAIGDRRSYNTALIVLDPDTLGRYVQRHELAATAPQDIVSDERVLAELDAAVGRANSTLSRVEQIKRFTVLEEQWAPGGEQLTPTLKPKRRMIAECYAPVIDAMYDEPPGGGREPVAATPPNHQGESR